MVLALFSPLIRSNFWFYPWISNSRVFKKKITCGTWKKEEETFLGEGFVVRGGVRGEKKPPLFPSSTTPTPYLVMFWGQRLGFIRCYSRGKGRMQRPSPSHSSPQRDPASPRWGLCWAWPKMRTPETCTQGPSPDLRCGGHQVSGTLQWYRRWSQNSGISMLWWTHNPSEAPSSVNQEGRCLKTWRLDASRLHRQLARKIIQKVT